MAKSELALTVITPEQQVLETPAESVVLPAHDGELGVLPQRAPLMCELGIGQLRYTKGNVDRRLFVDGGFAQVYDDRITVLTNRALPAEQITPAVVSAEAQRLRDADGQSPEARQQYERTQRRLSVLHELQPAAAR